MHLDVPYVPTHENIVKAMLDLAAVDDDDVLFDLGSGDGRIPVAAAVEHGARAVGVEI
ncbi:MAG: SAM-dependent methyltransferase, partial [Pseudomonas formosensis]|nr:SAM-dependent methyltransferase [Halopseudomonas formosensis]